MDSDALHSALLSLVLLSDQIHSARAEIAAANDLVPVGLQSLLDGMGRDLNIAKATLAREVGLPLCRCCWPPEVMIAPNGKPGQCPKAAGTERYLSPRLQMAKRKGNADFVSEQKERLLRLRDNLLDSVNGSSSTPVRSRVSVTETVSFGGDVADAGRDTSECDLALTLLSHGHEAIAEIDQALRRIERGVYGLCEISGRRIPRGRLQAIPFARYTVECQSEMERRQRGQMRPAVRPFFEDLGEDLEEEDDRSRRLEQAI